MKAHAKAFKQHYTARQIATYQNIIRKQGYRKLKLQNCHIVPNARSVMRGLHDQLSMPRRAALGATVRHTLRRVCSGARGSYMTKPNSKRRPEFPSIRVRCQKTNCGARNDTLQTKSTAFRLRVLEARTVHDCGSKLCSKHSSKKMLLCALPPTEHEASVSWDETCSTANTAAYYDMHGYY